MGWKKIVVALQCVFVAGLVHAADLAQRRQEFDQLVKEQWEYTLRSQPEYATYVGDKRYNDRLSDYSLAAVAADEKADRDFLRRFEAIDGSGFEEQEKLSLDLMVRKLRLAVEETRFKDWEMPVLQNSGPHLDLPQLVSFAPFATVKDYEDYIARLHQVPRLFNAMMQRMDAGIRDKRLPPQFLLKAIVGQCRDIARTDTAKSPFAQPLEKLPATFSDADKARLRKSLLDAVRHDVAPAYAKLATYVEKRYVPHGRKEVGMWSLPDGEANYAFNARRSTTTTLTPEQIHQIGLSEVARIETKMDEIARQLGFKDRAAFNASLAGNPALHVTSRQQIIDLYDKYTQQMNAKLPALFGTLPKSKLIIESMEAFREVGGPGAQYMRGTRDGSRPGRVVVNTGSFESRLTLSVETTALHEGVPGHHMQNAVAMELPNLPPFRNNMHFTAYGEGWALYAERLGEELGFYSDPYSNYGHLQDEMLRAIRLVVDTGLHYKRWSRQQVVDFFHAHSAFEEVEVQSETDRYIVWPGQALGYKIGQLKILELRAYAKEQLGAKFDIRAFHDQVLGAGALPLDVLEARIKAWVARQLG
ncbi:MAG: DUF885 family protein [Pseudomonadota bacterium]